MGSDTDSRIEKLLSNYQNLDPDRRWNIIDELESYSSHRADGLVPYLEPLTELLEWESGGNTVQVARLLESCLSEHTTSIETETLESLTELIRSNDEASQRVGLEALKHLYRRDPDAINGDFTADEIDGWLEGDPKDRALAYRILGATLAEGAIPRLASGFQSEVGPAMDAVREALEDIGSSSAILLVEQNSPEGATNLKQLADHVPEIAVEYQAALRQGLQAEEEVVVKSCATALIKLGYSKYCEQLDGQAFLYILDDLDHVHAGRAAGVVIGGQSEIGLEIVSTILDQIERLKGDNRQRVNLVALLKITERSSEPVAQYTERLRELDPCLSGQARIDYLDLLGTVISDVDNPGTIAPLLIKELESSNTEHVKTACEGLAKTNIYPRPHAVNRARRSKQKSVSSAAHKIYQRSESPEFVVADHLAASEEDSAFEELKSAFHYQTEPGRWDPISLPRTERQRLATVQTQYRNNSGGYMFLPHDVPEVGILPVVELALLGMQNDEPSDIYIYTPGTGSQWGTYGDLRSIFRKFGLTVDQGITTAALPLDEVISICRVVDGEITEWRETDSPTRVILTRSLKHIQSVDPDTIVCNFLGRRPAEFESKVDAVWKDLTSIPVFSLYSFTAKVEVPETWPEYGYPESVPETSSHLLSGAPRASSSLESGLSDQHTPGDTVTTQLNRLHEERPITVEQLGAGEIADRLQMMHYLALEMDTDETGHVVKAFKNQTRFVQSLPVPLDTWDDWIREESTATGPYSIDSSYQRIDNIDSLREDPPNATVPGTVYEYLIHLQELFDILRQHNPIYHRLLNQIESFIESEKQLAVLFRKRSSQQAFRYTLREKLGLRMRDLSEEGIHLLRPDSLRQIDGVDNIIMTHPLPPSKTQLYLSPLYDTMNLIGYEQETDEYVRESIKTRRDTLRSRQEVPEDVNWPVKPTIDGIKQTIGDSKSNHDIDPHDGRRNTDKDRSISEMWAQFEPDGEFEPTVADNMPDTGDEGGNNWTVQIMTERGVELLKPSDQPILIERANETMVGSQYIWAQIEDLQPDDYFILIPDQVRDRLFRQALESVYDDELAETDLLDGLRTWWKTLRKIASEYEELGTVYTLLEQNEIEKSKGTVTDWFDAVKVASKPLDLPMKPDLRIGPDSADDIRVIGETFGYPELVENAISIEHAMELSRGKNRSKGKEINSWMISRIQDADSEFVEEATSYTVARINHLGKQR